MVKLRVMKFKKTVKELIESGESPLPLDVIPNYMGINLCSVEAISWEEQDDGQLVTVTIHFIPDNGDHEERSEEQDAADALKEDYR